MAGRAASQIGEYRLLRLIAESDMFESWLAENAETGEQVYLKRPLNTTRRERNRLRGLLQNSHQKLWRLRHRSILTPQRFVDGEECHLVFDYLSPDKWRRLDSAMLKENLGTLLPKLCSVVDFIHAAGIVHCDLKADHFLICNSQSVPAVMLTDFDLACAAGSSPGGELLGTPGYIAPEISRNEIILPQSDQYSFGRMLQYLMAVDGDYLLTESVKRFSNNEPDLEISAQDLQREFRPLLPLLQRLTSTSYLDRPTYLGQVIREHPELLVSDPGRYDRRLIWAQLKAAARAGSGTHQRIGNSLTKLVRGAAKVVGVPDEILNDANRELSRNPVGVVRELNRLLERGTLGRSGDLWRLDLGHSTVLDFYASPTLLSIDQRALSSEELLFAGLRFGIKGQCLKALRVLESLLGVKQDSGTLLERNKGALLFRAGMLAKKCGFAQRANQLLRESLQTGGVTVQKRIRTLLELADPNAGISNYKEHLAILQQASAAARLAREDRLRVRVTLLKFMIRHRTGRSHQCIAPMQRLRRITSALGYVEQEARACNQIGLLLLRLGEVAQARQVLLEGIKLSADHGRRSLSIALNNNLSAAEFDQGRYTDSIQRAKTALSLAQKSNDPIRAIFAYRGLFSSNVMLGQYDEASRYMSELWSLELRSGDLQGLLEAELESAWAKIRRGQLEPARATLLSALRQISDLGSTSRAGGIFYLAMLEFRQGNLRRAHELAKESLAIFEKAGDGIWIVDSRLLLEQIASAETGKLPADKLREIIDYALQVNYGYGVRKCAFELLTRARESTDFAELYESLSGLPQLNGAAQDPFSDSLRDLLVAVSPEAGSQGSARIVALKDAYSKLTRAGLPFEAGAVADILADEIATENPKLAAAYLSETLETARRLGNKKWQGVLQKKINKYQRQSLDSDATVSALLEISSLLNSLADYPRVLEEILRKALFLTGAERSVLLLVESQTGRLRIEAALDCDRGSLEDIAAISNSVIESVFSTNEACLIADGTSDERTRNYNSIVMHNILSIACIPLVVRGELLGALYLDHHSIRGLFSAKDYTLIRALGNLVALAIDNARHLRNLQSEVDESDRMLRAHGLRSPLVTHDPVMLKMLEGLGPFARSGATVLITGESGTGKELIADLLHQYSSRAEAPFIKINCATLDGSLLESELFGIEKKVATGVDEREGKFEAADGGTIFLDEIGEMPPATQAKVLRLMENKSFERIGSNKSIYIDVRFIAATNKDLKEAVERGKFRADLYYRINGATLHLPPLQERPGDIMPIINHYLGIFNCQGLYQFDQQSRLLLESYPWPGNVRELRNFVERLTIAVPPGIVNPQHLLPEMRDAGRANIRDAIRDRTKAYEREQIVLALRNAKGNQSKAARSQNVALSTFRNRMKKYGINPDDFRSDN